MKKETENTSASSVQACQSCKQPFGIAPDDVVFYEKMKVPLPTWCPDCRMQRRMTWRNERMLYKRSCAATGKSVVSVFAPDGPVTVYDRDYWWSDEWDASAFGREYDFNTSLFLQFRKLLEKVPMPAIFNGLCTNSEYCNHVGEMKDCYLVFAAWDDERVAYSNKVWLSKDSLDGLASSNCELCYEMIQSTKVYQSAFIQNSENCDDSYFLYDCKGCSHCFGCVNLRNKQYHIFNKPYSKEEYIRELSKLDTGSYEGLCKIRERFLKQKEGSIHRYAIIVNSRGVTGDNVTHTNNCKQCFDVIDNVKDCKFIVNSGTRMRDTYDAYGVGLNVQLSYEAVDSGVNSSHLGFVIVAWESRNVWYSYNCHGCQDCFGCIGLRNKQYCILNKQYSKEEYEKLVPKIIDHMNEQPYVDKQGRVYKYGEFFPPELSPFAYNETIAQEYFPLTVKEAEKQRYQWRESEPKYHEVTKKSQDLPDHIKNVKDSILKETIGCEHGGTCNEQCTTAFKLIPQELQFYRKMNLPLPRLCPNCRHYQRLKQRNPLKLWHRRCQCAGKKSEDSTYENVISHLHGIERCPNEFETTYALERKETVYCQQCYSSEVV